MTVIDLVIITVTIFVLWRNFRTSTSQRPAAPKAGLRLIMGGIVVVSVGFIELKRTQEELAE